MATISFSGLNSQLDTDSIVESLVNVRTQQFITPLQSKIANIQTKQATLSTFQTILGNLKSAANTLNTTTSVTGRSASSSDTDILSLGDIDDDASEGTYSVYVNQIATYDRVYFTGIADSDATTFGSGTISITSNSVSTNVTIESTDTLEDIVTKINETDDMNVVASIVNDGTGATPYRLVLTSRDTGDDADISYDFSALTGLSADAALTTANDSVDASVTINSLTITKSTNTFTEAIPGVTFTVEDVSTDPLTVTVESDLSSVESAISSFVSAYNTLARAYTAQFTYDEDTESMGALGTDLTLQQSQMRTRRFVFDIYDNLGLTDIKSLVDLGITVDEDGQMSLDTDTLETALEDHSTEVLTLFQGTDSADGLMEGLYNYLDSLLDSTDGTLTQKSEIYDDTIDGLNDLIDERQTRIDAYEANLTARFVYMEQALTSLHAMQDTLDNFSEQLSRNNND